MRTHEPAPQDQPANFRLYGASPASMLPPGMYVQRAPVDPAFEYAHRSAMAVKLAPSPPNMYSRIVAADVPPLLVNDCECRAGG